MRLLADVHIAPRTVQLLRSLGHDVVRVSEALSPTASDAEIVTHAIEQRRTVLTHDLDLSSVVALSRKVGPSLISIRLSSTRIEHVNAVLERVLPGLEEDAREGMIFTVEDERIRRRRLPIT